MLLGSEILEVAIGLAFLYLLLAIVCSTLVELGARALKLRSDTLKEGIGGLLEDKDFNTVADALYNHPLIKSLEKEGRPSYIRARTFASALLDTVVASGTAASDLKSVITANEAIPVRLRRQLEAVIPETTNPDEVRKAIETWYDDAMERVSGWYKRKAQLITLAMGIVVTVLLNADTLTFANSLLQNPAAREAFVASATEIAAASPAPGSQVPTLDLAQVKTQLEPVGFGLGWSLDDKATKPEAWLARLLGWVITILAITMGAPFWFDVVTRLTNIRATGVRPKRADEERDNP